jgi:hypothetical protein
MGTSNDQPNGKKEWIKSTKEDPSTVLFCIIIAVLAIALVVALCVRIFGTLRLSDFKEWVDIFFGIVSISGILLGGWWTYKVFIKNRLPIPKARTEHAIQQFELPEDKCLIRLCLTIKNIGSVLLELKHFEMKVYRVLPYTQEIESIVDGEKYPLSKDQEKEELPWETLYEKDVNLTGEKIVKIDPNEEDYRYYDFILSSDDEIVIFYSHVQYKDEIIGWNLATTYRLC